MFRLLRRHLPACLPLLLGAAPALAAENDHQVWAVLNANVDLGNRFTTAFDFQYRITDHASRTGQVLVRPAVGYYLNENTAAYLGYAFVTTDFVGITPSDEHRIFEQVIARVAGDGKGPTLTTRTRLEQRFVEGRTGTGWRWRQQGRGTVPIGSGLALVSTIEAFVAFNTTEWGQRAGFDQVRAFGGVALPVARGITAEAGYMGQYVARYQRPDRMNHIVSLSLSLKR